MRRGDRRTADGRGVREAAKRAAASEGQGRAPAMPTGAVLKEEGAVPPMRPPDAYVKQGGGAGPANAARRLLQGGGALDAARRGRQGGGAPSGPTEEAKTH